MQAGGATESLWYFAGYLHLATNDLKARLEYEDGALRVKQEDYVVELPDFDALANLPEFFTRRIALEEVAPDPLGSSSFDSLKLQIKPPVTPVERPEIDDIARKLPTPVSGGEGGIVFPQLTITATYGIGGDQMLAEIEQLNMLDDNDQLLDNASSSVTALNDIDVPAVLQGLVSDANDQVPGDLRLPQSGTADAAEFLKAFDAKVAAGEVDDQHSVAPGFYVNGELQDEPPPEEPEPADDAAEPDEPTEVEPGQWAELGGNTLINAALIVDLNEAAPTTIVMGDYFMTNAVVQTNSFVDNDQVNLGSNAPNEVIAGDNKADNIANFIENAGPHALVSAKFAGFAWKVDVVDGNFYDISLLTQKNYLEDNDVTVQDSSLSHYQVEAGANGQFNLIELEDWGLQYDLIIVAGDFHGGNFIFQHNIVLDSDFLMIGASDGSAPPQQALAGENALSNDATIATYGNNAFVPLAPGMSDMAAALAGRDGTLDPSFASLIAGNGSGVLNVLYVTGDYYDINAIWQINVIADVDTAIQLLSGPGSQDAVAQSASVGGNEATNSAAIVDVGSTYSYLDGEFYQDSMLVQANLVADDEDDVTYGDTDTLISELIAFTGPPDDENGTELGSTSSPTPADDPIGSVLH